MLILTPNRRLAAFSLRQYNLENLHSGKRSWQTAEIYSLDAWIAQLWELCLNYLPHEYTPLLSTTQQQLLLEQIISQSDLGVELLRIGPTAKNIIQAWDFISAWQISLNRLASYAEFSTDTAAFYIWINSYLVWLDEHSYIDANLMLAKITQLLPELHQHLPTEICLRGFGDFSPQLEAFFNTIRSLGVKTQQDQIIKPGAKVARLACADEDAELSAAANWAAQHLQTNPQQTIGIVVPELEKTRRKVASTFKATIPEEILNISAPLSLADYGLIESALVILQSFKPQINFNDFSILLRSPFVRGGQAHMHQRARLDRELRNSAEARLSLQKVMQIFEIQLPNLSLAKEQHTASFWVQCFQQILTAWGWPGLQQIDRQQMDLLACWTDLLNEYVNLSIIAKEHNMAQALQIITRLAGDTPFLPAETGNTKVHVLGLLEADGISFDQLWVTGMSRETWPPEINPNPFIPLELQRQFDLPKSSAQREFKIAQRLTANLQMGAKQNVIFSYPSIVEEQPSDVTNLLVHLPIIELSLNYLQDFTNTELQAFSDDLAPVLKDTIKGGTSILRLQAQCPFKANAELRLFAQPLAEPLAFLDPAQRGSIVHEVLEKFWLRCVSQQQLRDWYPEAAQQVLDESIDQVLAVWRKKLPYTLNSTYVELEKNRLLTLIMAWLKIELEREPFIVKELEQKKHIQIGPLQINARVDRIDQFLEDGLAIIDYKTGLVKVSDWFTEPLIEPQLPLYALNETEPLAEVAYACLREDDLRFRGIDNAGELDANTLQNWRVSLENTAQEFAAGLAKVQPFSPQICAVCKLQALCRIYEANA